MPNFHRDTHSFCLFFFNDTATTEIYTLSLHDALPISWSRCPANPGRPTARAWVRWRSEEHTSELQSQSNLVCRLLLEKKKKLSTRSAILPRCLEPRRAQHVVDTDKRINQQHQPSVEKH